MYALSVPLNFTSFALDYMIVLLLSFFCYCYSCMVYDRNTQLMPVNGTPFKLVLTTGHPLRDVIDISG